MLSTSNVITFLYPKINCEKFWRTLTSNFTSWKWIYIRGGEGKYGLRSNASC